MKTLTSILRSAPGAYEIAEVELEGPRVGELTIKLAAAGLCHSDDHMATGDIPSGTYPLAGGHEGSGVVVEVGRDTPGWEVGDHIIFAFLPSCGKCRWCAAGKQNLCDLGKNIMVGSRYEDPTSFRMHLDGQPVGQYGGISTFSQYTTISVNSAVKVSKDIPLAPLSLIGCGVGTGWGTAVNAAAVRPGETVMIVGAGGIGTAAIQGASHAGAANVIAVDLLESKRNGALTFGATHAAGTIAEGAEIASAFTNGQGPDSVMITVGVLNADIVAECIQVVRKDGTVVITAAGNYQDSLLPINFLEFTMSQKKLKGALFGQASPFTTIPWLTEMYVRGQLKLDEMISKRYGLDQVAEAYEDLHAGKILRGIVDFDLPIESPKSDFATVGAAL